MKAISKRMGVLLALVSTQAALAAGNTGAVQTVDGVAVVVNDAVITQQEVGWLMRQNKAALPKGSTVSDAELRQQAIQQLINQNLLVQAAQRANLTVTAADVDAEVARLAQARKMSADKFYAAMAKEGVERNQLRRTLTENLLAKKVIDSESMSNSQVSDAEVDDALARAKAAGRELPPPVASYAYHVEHILVKDDTEDSRKLIRQIAEKARSGVNFEQLARQYSQDGSAANGGDLGWITEGQTVAPFEAAVKALKPGQVSQPVRTQFGWHIVRLLDVKSDNTPEERQRNGMRVALRQEKQAAATQNLLRQLYNQSFVQVR